MIINKIELKNYRIYKGQNTLEFRADKDKNVHIISGENGFGKTTLLTGLVWCLYGKLMVDVDEKYKREIYEAGGYRKYANSQLNRDSKDESDFSVSISLAEIFIPSIPCQEIQVTRTFSLAKQEDRIEILIDGQPNELTREVGSEIFIHDFILPKEIAKFFFFDAEKIVSLAEMKSIEDKKMLGKAYSEVLGIKKYVDLRNHLQDLRLRFKRSSASVREKEKFTGLQKDLDKLQSHLEFNREQIINLSEEREIKKRLSEQYQEKLIREGNSLSVEELLDLKKMRDQLAEERKKIRSQLKELLDLAPFAIAGNCLKETRSQANKEILSKSGRINPSILREKAQSIAKTFKENGLDNSEISTKKSKQLLSFLNQAILKEFSGGQQDFKVLLDFSDSEHNEFIAIWDNVNHSFSVLFKELVTADRNNRITFNKAVRKISNAESKENDLLVKDIREEKNTVDNQIKEIEEKIALLHQDIGSKQRELSVLSRQVSELAKKINLDEGDRRKDEIAERQIIHLDKFLGQLKKEKKATLEKRVKTELNRLMHKNDFVHSVEAEVKDEIIDINLFDQSGEVILKESLSKGEQQLYATSILKALVDESNIKFPIFIDSPLQKFDKRHSTNIINDFYPNISEQVVLFPLLEKELSRAEYDNLLPHINSTYIIRNIDHHQSEFRKVDPMKLFNTYYEYIFAHQNIS